MVNTDLKDIVISLSSQVAELKAQVATIRAKEDRATGAVAALRRRIETWLAGFHRDKYKSTDQRLITAALARELLIFDKLGYELAIPGAGFVLGVAALLEGRNQAALEHFESFIGAADSSNPVLADAHYLAAMICYNRRDYRRGMEHFQGVFGRSPAGHRDWQSRIYVAELMFFLRMPPDVISRELAEVEDGMRSEDLPEHDPRRATLYLKWGNCFVGTLDLEPIQHNPMVNNQVAVAHYKQARRCLPRHGDPESLLPVIVDYSLAQALLLSGSIDMDLSMTPSEMLADVFCRLRRVVLSKREEIILAQCYLMLGSCACHAPRHVSQDAGKIYLEHARNQTLAVPSDVCFYSCITKELVGRDEFVRQIDFFANRLEQGQPQSSTSSSSSSLSSSHRRF